MENNINVTPAKVEHNLVKQTSNKANNEELLADESLNIKFDKTQIEESENLKKASLTESNNKYLEKIKAENKEPTEEELQNALATVSNFMSSTLKQIDFLNDSSSGKTVIKVFDKETKELISQFPSDKIIFMAEKIKNLHQEIENTSGLLVDNIV